MSQLPLFYFDGALAANSTVILDADTGRHIWQVLRMVAGDQILISDGKGTLATCTLNNSERHTGKVTITKSELHTRIGGQLHLCVAFTKNNSRNEWLLEKAAELGVASIVPLIVSRSEKTHMRADRLLKILQSAMVQSQQYYLPQLFEPTKLEAAAEMFKKTEHKLIAHCIHGQPKMPLSKMLNPSGETVILIGPEGDFTPNEVTLCLMHGFKPVSLGNHRLRTETAAITAAAYFNVMNDEAI